MQKQKTFLLLFLIICLGIGAGLVALSSLITVPKIPSIPFRLGLDLQGGTHLVYEADLSQVEQKDHNSAMEGLRDVIERRVNLFGITEPVVQTEGQGKTRRLIVELAGITDPATAIRLIGETPFLEFKEPKDNYEELIQANEDPFKPAELTGRFLKRAQLGFDEVTGSPNIELEFNEEGAKIFEELTARNIGKPLAIFLDYQLIQAPVVQETISQGRAQITGSFTVEQARKAARELNAGALPVPISLLSQQSVGPALGRESLELSLKAGIIGFLLVIVFMILMYRLAGLFAVLTLLLYIAFLLFLFKLIPITLTLAGIGGFILSIGMAVDANILVFSRMREEFKEGKSFSAALEEGFRRAWPSIRDGNLTTLLVAVILFWLGSSFVQGFALVLSLGILLSMFSAMVITRLFLQLFTGSRLEKIQWIFL